MHIKESQDFEPTLHLGTQKAYTTPKPNWIDLIKETMRQHKINDAFVKAKGELVDQINIEIGELAGAEERTQQVLELGIGDPDVVMSALRTRHGVDVHEDKKIQTIAFDIQETITERASFAYRGSALS